MDVERTMEFILQVQAKSEERMAKAEARMTMADKRMDRAEARMDRADARMQKFDRRMEAMRKLVETGMRWLVKIEKQMSALAEAQRISDRKFERFMDSWGKRRSNGHRPSR